MTAETGAIDTAAIKQAHTGEAGNVLTSAADRNTWRDWLAQATSADATERLEDLLARHPRFTALQDGFSVGTYLARNLDVASAVDHFGEAVFHYLEFGITEGRNGTPTSWDADIVARIHGHALPAHLTAPQAASTLLQRGISPADLVLTERDLWLSYGLHGPALTGIFHHEAYFAAVEVAGLDLPAPDRLSCIRHFANVGLDAGLPAHPDHHLDVDYYAATLAEMSQTGPATLRHWASVGLRTGLHADRKSVV